MTITPARIVALTASILIVVLPGLLLAYGIRSVCGEGSKVVACPVDPIGPHGGSVSDKFAFVHRPLDRDGTITVRLTSLTGTITYPPPDHDEIVSGVVPWAKAGLIVKDGLTQGSQYAALMVTGSHGVRLQHNYVHDIAGRPGRVTAKAPRWLRLSRSGDTITGAESADGVRWTAVGTVRLPGLPARVRVGLFTASPGNVTFVRTALGASLPESRFAQASADFDHVRVSGAPSAPWQNGLVGEHGHTDWEKYHRASGVSRSGSTFSVTGSGDIGPVGEEGGHRFESTLVGVALGLVIVIVVAARIGARGPTRRSAVVTGGICFVAGSLAAGITTLAGAAALRANGVAVVPASVVDQVRVIVGVGAVFAVTAVIAFALGARFRRAWAAALVTTGFVVVPYVIAVLPILPDQVAGWLLRLTPAAGFAVQQTAHEYPQVLGHYAPSAGFYPLPWWGGLLLLCAYGVVACWTARRDVDR